MIGTDARATPQGSTYDGWKKCWPIQSLIDLVAWDQALSV
jgi:hypothetical protein